MPSLCGRVGKKGQPSKTEVIYDGILGRYENSKMYRLDVFTSLRYTDRLMERADRLKGRRRFYQLRVVLFTQARQQDPNDGRGELNQDKTFEQNIKTRLCEEDKAKQQGILQFWTGHLTVKACNDGVVDQEKDKLTIRDTT